MLEVCEVRSYLSKTDNNNNKAHKNDANTLS